MYAGYGIDDDFDLYCIGNEGVIAAYREKQDRWIVYDTPLSVDPKISPVTESSMLRRTEGKYPDSDRYREINSPLKMLMDEKAMSGQMHYTAFYGMITELLEKETGRKDIKAYLWMHEHALPCYYLLGCDPEDIVKAMLRRKELKG